MKCEGEKTYEQPGRCPACKMKLKPVNPESPALVLEVTNPSEGAIPAGQDGTVSLRLKAPKPNDETALLKRGEAPVDVCIVSKDLSWFAHEQASLSPEGDLAVRVGFPHPGPFTVFADLGANRAKVEPVEYSITGAAPPEQSLSLDDKAQKLEDGYEASLRNPGAVKVSGKSTLSFTVARDGAPLKVLGPALSEHARLILVSQDRKACIVVPARTSRGGTPEAAGARPAADIPFDVTVPKQGLYGAWLEFNHGDKLRRARFVLEAKP